MAFGEYSSMRTQYLLGYGVLGVGIMGRRIIEDGMRP